MTVVTIRDVSAPPLERHTATYLAAKRKRLTAKSERGYSAVLREFVAAHPDRELGDFEPPRGSVLIEDFLNARWGDCAPRTYNKSLSVLSDFFRWHVVRATMNRDPMLTIEKATARAVHRTTFTEEQRQRILATNPWPRDQVALRLLLDYGLRKGALQNVQLKHFDPVARRLVIFTKGEKVFTVPVPDDGIWRHIDQLLSPDVGEQYLIPRQERRRRRPPHRKQFDQAQALLAELRETVAKIDDGACERELAQLVPLLGIADDWLCLTVNAASVQVRRFHDERGGEHLLHSWWYRCLTRAGIVEPGVRSGQRLHKARHSAGQRVLDRTGNLKAAQAMLCHATIGTTGDIYVGWDLRQQAETMRAVVPADDLTQTLHGRVREEGVRV